MAALVATGVARTGERRILGLELSSGNDEGSAWPRFVGGLVERGLHGFRLVISDDHAAGWISPLRDEQPTRVIGSPAVGMAVRIPLLAQDGR